MASNGKFFLSINDIVYPYLWKKNYKQDFKTKSSINDIHSWERNYEKTLKQGSKKNHD